MLTVSLQVIIVVVMVHGVKTEMKSFLLPYIVYGAIAVLTGSIQVIIDVSFDLLSFVLQIVSDLVYLDKSVAQHADANTRIAKRLHLNYICC